MGRRGSPCCSLAEIVTLCTWLGTLCARCPHLWSTDEPHGRGRRWDRNGAWVASYQACGIVPCQRVCSLLVSGCSRGLGWIYRAPTCLATWLEIFGPCPLCVPLHPDPQVLNLPPQECTLCSPQVSYVSVPASWHAQRPNWEQKGTEAPPCTDVAIPSASVSLAVKWLPETHRQATSNHIHTGGHERAQTRWSDVLFRTRGLAFGHDSSGRHFGATR